MDIIDKTKKELLEMQLFYEGKPFNGIVIVPTNRKHESGYQCMKYILLDNTEIVGVVGGASDVVHINGIGGGGFNYSEFVKAHSLSIDCLPKSKCLRLFSRGEYMIIRDNFIMSMSDFVFYFEE